MVFRLCSLWEVCRTYLANNKINGSQWQFDLLVHNRDLSKLDVALDGCFWLSFHRMLRWIHLLINIIDCAPKTLNPRSLTISKAAYMALFSLQKINYYIYTSCIFYFMVYICAYHCCICFIKGLTEGKECLHLSVCMYKKPWQQSQCYCSVQI